MKRKTLHDLTWNELIHERDQIAENYRIVSDYIDGAKTTAKYSRNAKVVDTALVKIAHYKLVLNRWQNYIDDVNQAIFNYNDRAKQQKAVDYVIDTFNTWYAKTWVTLLVLSFVAASMQETNELLAISIIGIIVTFISTCYLYFKGSRKWYTE